MVYVFKTNATFLEFTLGRVYKNYGNIYVYQLEIMKIDNPNEMQVSHWAIGNCLKSIIIQLLNLSIPPQSRHNSQICLYSHRYFY